MKIVLYTHDHRLVFLERAFLFWQVCAQQLNLQHYFLFSSTLPLCLKVHTHHRHELKISFASPNCKFRPFYITEMATLIISWNPCRISVGIVVELPYLWDFSLIFIL